MAGQIALVPATLQMIEPATWSRQAALSSQHVRRLIAAAPSGREYQLEAGLVWLSSRVPIVAGLEAWSAFAGDARVRQPSRPNANSLQAPVLAVAADDLPKDASVEWLVTCGQGPFSDCERSVVMPADLCQSLVSTMAARCESDAQARARSRRWRCANSRVRSCLLWPGS